MTDVGGGCRRLLGEGEDFCIFSTHLLVVSVTGLSNRNSEMVDGDMMKLVFCFLWLG